MSWEFEVSFHRDLGVANEVIVFVFQCLVNLSELACQFNLHLRPLGTVKSHNAQILISPWLKKLIELTIDSTHFKTVFKPNQFAFEV